eukprot:6101045-Prymnesium_polylepis.1
MRWRGGVCPSDGRPWRVVRCGRGLWAVRAAGGVGPAAGFAARAVAAAAVTADASSGADTVRHARRLLCGGLPRYQLDRGLLLDVRRRVA